MCTGGECGQKIQSWFSLSKSRLVGDLDLLRMVKVTGEREELGSVGSSGH